VAKQKFGLGRGLDALISGASEVMAAQQSSRVDEENILHIPINTIIPNPRQPRRILTEGDPKLLELSISIKQHGLLQPLVVTRLDTDPAFTASSQKTAANDSWFGEEFQKDEASQTSETVIRYQIIAGERRWRAARIAGLTKVPAVLKEATPQEMLELALIENIQRADLNAIEEALAYQSLIHEFGLTQEIVARAVGKDRSTITNALRLLTLAPKVREALVNQPENFSEGHARALAGINREEDQVAAMGKIIALKLNVRQAEEMAARIKAAERAGAASQEISASPPKRSPELEDLESQFRNALMVKVDLKRSAKGKGTLVLHFNNKDELERLYTRLVKHEE
jgi:ParB family transcriptional regulator, chromosome partitioning protein